MEREDAAILQAFILEEIERRKQEGTLPAEDILYICLRAVFDNAALERQEVIRGGTPETRRERIHAWFRSEKRLAVRLDAQA